MMNIGNIKLRLKIKNMYLYIKGDKSKASTTGQSTRDNKKELKHIEEKPL